MYQYILILLLFMLQYEVISIEIEEYEPIYEREKFLDIITGGRFKYNKYKNSEPDYHIITKPRYNTKIVNHEDSNYFYDYDIFKKQYSTELNYLETNKTEVKKHKSHLRKALESIFEVEMPRNCTYMVENNYGIESILCVVKDGRENGAEGVKRHLFKILLFWLLVYAAVAVPLWLIKGWCCCCFRCKSCFPSLVAEQVKTYIVHNPPGIITLKNGKKINYPPQDYEIEIFKEIEVKAFSF